MLQQIHFDVNLSKTTEIVYLLMCYGCILVSIISSNQQLIFAVCSAEPKKFKLAV